MRLIDADALKEIFDGSYCETSDQDVATIIDEQPTIDPVKHGKWNSRHNGLFGIVFECSECGQLRSATVDWNYCPSCGARMDGE